MKTVTPRTFLLIFVLSILIFCCLDSNSLLNFSIISVCLYQNDSLNKIIQQKCEMIGAPAFRTRVLETNASMENKINSRCHLYILSRALWERNWSLCWSTCHMSLVIVTRLRHYANWTKTTLKARLYWIDCSIYYINRKL